MRRCETRTAESRGGVVVALLPLFGLLIALPLFLAPPTLAQAAPPAAPAAPAGTADEAGKVKAEEESEPVLHLEDSLDVTSRASDLVGVADSASEGITGKEDLERRPILRPGELLETVPGVIITQHSGGGKANQYFLRGFNLDHGTDFRVTVDGMPVNLPTHGHGQGYSDLNFLIPELVESLHYKKGTYSADEGDFSTAGAADIAYVDSLDKGLLSLTPGTEGFGRLVAAQSTKIGGGDLLGAVELGKSDGPWDRPDDYRKSNGVLRYSRGDRANGFNVTAMGYRGRWSSTDQIPERAVASGELGRFGNLDDSSGGQTHRYSLSAERRWGSGESIVRASAYAVQYELDLFSNFTYFLDDPERGDQFEQTDDRSIFGFAVERQWTASAFGREIEATAGVQGRADDIRNGLFHTERRVRLETTRRDDVLQGSFGPYAQARVRWTPWLRTVAGLRADFYLADVDSNVRENSGSAHDTILSPKLSLLFGPWKETEVYLNLGTGFHSNDARGATITVDPRTHEPASRVDPLVRAKSVDLGFRTSAYSKLQSAVTFFLLDLDSELVFVGDAGITEASRPSRRTGIELQNFWRPRPWLSIDADAALSRGRFRDAAPEGDRIPGSIEKSLSAGVSVDDLGPWFGSLRLRYFGPRPLVEDGSVRSRSTSLVNGRLGRTFAGGLSLALEVFNLFDERASDIDYFYESRLRGEAAPVEDIHFHPAEKRSFRLGLAWRI